MAKWRVWNKHPEGLTHEEKFREDIIKIPAGSYIEMDYEDAVLFKGQYFPMSKNPDGTPSSKSFKVIHLEPVSTAATEQVKQFVCQMTGKKFATEAELNAHLETFKEHVFKDEALDQEIETEKRRGKRQASA